MTKNGKNLKGFTLVELLVVVAVIGVLAAITAPSISNMIDRSRSREFARGIANQYRLARDQAASTNQAFVVRLYRQGTTFTSRGRVEVWAVAGPDPLNPLNPANCRSLDFPTTPSAPEQNMISVFEGESIGGNMVIRQSSQAGGGVSTVCVQPNGEFLEISTGTKLNVFSNNVAGKMCLGESMVVPIWNAVSFPNEVFDCASTTTADQIQERDQYDYWRISLWDNGQVTVSRK